MESSISRRERKATVRRLRGCQCDSGPVVQAALQLGQDERVAAALFSGYASIQQDLGQWLRAEEFYRRAAAMWARLRPDGPEQSVVLHDLATLYIQREQCSKAEQLLTGLDLGSASKGSWPASLEPLILNTLGVLAFTRRDLNLAESLYLRSIALCERRAVIPMIELSAALNGLGAV